MVKLTLTPHRGNGARTFPSTGYLGMTPVTLAGVVRVKIEEDMKSVEASSLVVRVRCYESVDGGAPVATSTSDRTSSNAAAGPSPGYHSSNCLGGPSSSNPSGYSITDILRGGSSSSSASSTNGNNAKGRVLYEKSVQMWSPPSTPASTSSSKPDSADSSTSSSRSSSLERSSQQHAYPPRSREQSSSSKTIPSSSSTQVKEQYSTLGEFTKAWRIVIPVNAIEKGAKSTMIYKNWRIWWTVEAGMFHSLN